MKLIGLTGNKQNGKDTFAEFIGAHFQYRDAPRIAFARALKQEVAKIFETDIQWLNNNKQHPLVRHCLQWWGFEFQRKNQGDNYWIKQLDKTVNSFTEGRFKYAVITDCRFQNEADYVISKGGIIVKIVNSRVKSDDTHTSEVEQKKIYPHYIIYNEGSLLNLRDCADYFMALVIDFSSPLERPVFFGNTTLAPGPLLHHTCQSKTEETDQIVEGYSPMKETPKLTSAEDLSMLASNPQEIEHPFVPLDPPPQASTE